MRESDIVIDKLILKLGGLIILDYYLLYILRQRKEQWRTHTRHERRQYNYVMR